jgi:hypothetical protein
MRSVSRGSPVRHMRRILDLWSRLHRSYGSVGTPAHVNMCD